MKELMKYHKQKMPKELTKELDRFNKKYNLKLKNNLLDYFYIMVFKTGLRNKNVIEKTFEAFRNKQLDMWDNLSFNERNLLLSHDLDPIKEGMPHFEYEKSTIYIPFFDVLMNNLYDRETAILELPQFFKLYDNFEASIVDMRLYGHLPFIHNMTDLHYVCHEGIRTVLYFDLTHTFYCIEGEKVETYPFYEKRDLSDSVRLEMGTLILSNPDEEALFDLAMKHQMMHPKLEKRLLRRKSK